MIFGKIYSAILIVIFGEIYLAILIVAFGKIYSAIVIFCKIYQEIVIRHQINAAVENRDLIGSCNVMNRPAIDFFGFFYHELTQIFCSIRSLCSGNRQAICSCYISLVSFGDYGILYLEPSTHLCQDMNSMMLMTRYEFYAMTGACRGFPNRFGANFLTPHQNFLAPHLIFD